MWISRPTWETITVLPKSAKRILLVEDAQEISSSVAELLTDEGYEVSCAANGLEALALLQSTEALPDLILLDLMMPEMDGYQFRTEQKQNPLWSAIPVVLMTAGVDIRAKARELGARGYLPKPFKDLNAILDAVGSTLTS
jgi:CheY-like chemotaxis protein